MAGSGFSWRPRLRAGAAVLALAVAVLAATRAGNHATEIGGARMVASSSSLATGSERLLDTRIGLGARRGAVPAGASVRFQVTGHRGVPASGALSVRLRTTVISPTHSGYISEYRHGIVDPKSTLLRFQAVRTTRGDTTVVLGLDGQVSVTNHSAGRIQLVVDKLSYRPLVRTDSWEQSVGDGGLNLDNPLQKAITPTTVRRLQQAWRLHPPGGAGPSNAAPVISGGVAYSVSLAPNHVDYELRASNLVTGRRLWGVRPTKFGFNRGVAVVRGVLFAAGDGEGAGPAGVTAIRLSTHRVMWTAAISKGIETWLSTGSIYAFAVDSGHVFLSGSTGNLDVLNAATGKHEWTQRAKYVEGIFKIVGFPAAADGLVVFTQGGHRFVRDAATGRALWEVRGSPSDTATIAGRLIYLTSQTDVSAYRLAGCGKPSCAPLWSVPIWSTAARPSRGRPAQPADWDNAQVILSGADTGSLVVTVGDIEEGFATGLSIANGGVLWTTHFNDANFRGPAIRAGQVAFVLNGTELTALPTNCRGTCPGIPLAIIEDAGYSPPDTMAAAEGTLLIQDWIPGDLLAFRLH